jgi:hypothetical protein
MAIPAKGTLDKFQAMTISDWLSPYSKGFRHYEPSRADIQVAAFTLDMEYREVGENLDKSFLNDKISTNATARRLQNFAIYMPIVRNIINVENPNYVRPPVRLFKNDKGDLIDDDIAQHLNYLYEQMNFNSHLLTVSRQGAYMGTVMSFPTVDETTGLMKLVKLTPDNDTLDVMTDIYPSEAVEVKYNSLDIYGNTVINEIDVENVVMRTQTASGESVEVNPHGFKKKGVNALPIAVLRYDIDSNYFWGAYDGGLLSLVKSRSLLLSDAIHRSQTSLFEFLVFHGFTPEEALAAAKSKSEGAMAYKYDKDDTGKIDPNSKSIEYVAPDGIAPEKIFELFEKVYRMFLISRGHSSKNVDTSQLIHTAEAMRLSNIALIENKESKRSALQRFEQDMLDLIIHSNNMHSNNPKIPEGLELILDWQPDKQFFNNATDKVNYYDFSLKKNVLTPVDIIRQENPELSLAEAEAKYYENKQFNKDNEVIADIEPLLNPNQEGGQDAANSRRES